MHWPRLFLQKETMSTTGYKKVEWTATAVEVEGIKLDGPLPAGGKAKKIGTGRAEVESLGAFAPEARGELRIALGDLDLWSEFSNDKAALGAGENDTLRILFDQPSIVLEGKPEIVFEKPRGRAPTLLLGATRGDTFLGYLPAALKAGGTLAFIFGTSALMPWFLPCEQPLGGQKLIEAPKIPQELLRKLGDEANWKRFEDAAGKFFEPILAARAMFTALQYVRYG